MRPPLTHSLNRETGVALAVGLMLLVVLTVIGITAVRMTTGQVRMAANNQFQVASFQGAESAIREIVAEVRGQLLAPSGYPDILTSAIGNTTVPFVADPKQQRSITLKDVTATSTTTYMGTAPAPGYSMSVGPGSMVAYRFNIQAVATVANTSAQEAHQQGIQRVGPQ